MGNIRLLQLFLLCALWAQASGIIVDAALQTSAPQAVAAFLSFGMVRGGHINMNYSVSTPDTAGAVDLSQETLVAANLQFELMVVTEDQRLAYYSTISLTQNATEKDTCMNPVTFRREISGSGSITHTFGANEPDAEQYSVLLVQCRDGSPSVVANASIHATLLNPLPYSSAFTHLDITDTAHLRVDQGLIAVYSAMLLALFGQMWFARKYFTAIHWLFATTVAGQVADITLDYYYYLDASKYGVPNHTLAAASNIVDYAAETCILLSFLMLSLGWSTLQFRLSQKQLMRVVSSLSMFFFLGIGSSFCFDSSSTMCQSLYLVTHVVRALILLAIIICLNFTITQLRSMLAHSPWDPSTPYYYSRARQFMTFRVVFIAYLMFPTAFLLIQDLMFTWKESWINFMLLELRNVLLLLVTGTAFAPFRDAFLTRAFDGTFSQNTRAHQA